MADKQQPRGAVYHSEVSFSITWQVKFYCWSVLDEALSMRAAWITWSRRDSSFFFLCCQGAKETKQEDMQICVAYGFLPLPEQLHTVELYCCFTWFLITLSASFHWNLIKSRLAGGNELGCLVCTVLVSGCSRVFQRSFWLERQTGCSKETKVHCLLFSCLCFFHIIVNHSSGLEPRVGNWDSVGLNS